MSAVLSVVHKPWIGFEAKRLRQALCLKQHELAKIAGVTLEEVNSFEHGLSVRLDAKLKILRELWVRNSSIKINRDVQFLQ